MCRFVRYGVSHCLRAAAARMRQLRGGEAALTARSSARALSLLSRVSLLLAVCLGLYARWETRRRDADLLAVSAGALAVLGVAAALRCYLRTERLGGGVLHLWLGALLGLLCFVGGGGGGGPHDAKARAAADGLLLTGAALDALRALLERVCGCAEQQRRRAAFLTAAEWLQLLGFGGASLAVTGAPSAAVFVSALAALVVVVRVKAVLALHCLVGFAFVTDFLFVTGPPDAPAADPAALACFLSRLLVEPLLDYQFGGSSVTERWQPLLGARRWGGARLLLPLVAAVDAAFLALAASRMPAAGQLYRMPYLMVPAFVACALFWGTLHLVFWITLWGFHRKMSGCQRVCLAQGSGVNSLDKVMASQGVRHYCLISQRLVLLTLLSTLVLAAFAGLSASSLSVSLSLLALLLESLFHGLFHELGNTLGGTCVGYALVIPTNYCSLDGQPTLLPPDQVQQLNQRSTDMLNKVQLFFAHHMIENAGCDYSTSGLSLDALQAKLRAFLELRTADGPRHDTYVVFYSGHTHRSGEWALAGGDTLQLERLVTWWRERNAAARSRLILVLDVDHALPWTRAVRRVGAGPEDAGLYVAVQGATLSPCSSDPERQDGGRLGDFTHRWVEFNCSPGGAADVRWSEPGHCRVSAVYGVSRHWGDYALHLPTESDVSRHWQTYFPRVTYPVVRLALWASPLDLFWGCGVVQRCLRRLKLNWFPPAVLDTGQGFKLVRS